MYGEHSMYLTSVVGGGSTGLALAATTGISAMAAVLMAVTVLFTLMLVVRIVRRGARLRR
ncbi:hypothetical protein [Actinomycetospora cinnamomea]|uniref:Uncharacterized protein n=1 Tax=Actinomycetospora cinnamomea TaxID=663609 RepID=A0A2U1EBF6_9PSEU|nr:hypothetical protein [Actinomycetospora cinnamomea]PVY97283.1 hypothetical protein C8D89_12525 [Actinomycetospora cinnamomea]